jgi:hypothetical protein
MKITLETEASSVSKPTLSFGQRTPENYWNKPVHYMKNKCSILLFIPEFNLFEKVPSQSTPLNH